MEKGPALSIVIPVVLTVAAVGAVLWRALASRRTTVLQSNESALGARVERSHWEMVSGVVALVVGVLALGITAYTAYLQRKQAQAAVWPRITFGKSDRPQFRAMLTNKGVGPAKVRYVALRIDGHPVASWNDAVRIVKPDGGDYVWGTMHTSVLTAGETIEAFSAQDDAMTVAMDRAWGRFSAVICYCSIFDECWTIDEAHSDANPVAECPAPGPESFTQ